MPEAALPLIKAAAPADELARVLRPDELAVYKLSLELMETKRVSAATYAETKAALGNDDRKMADLSLTLGCYGAVSTLLNMFEVPVPTGEPLPAEGVSALRTLFYEFQAGLAALSERIDTENDLAHTRPFPRNHTFNVVNPKYLDTSVSV